VSFKFLKIASIICFAFTVKAQSFDIEQITQLIRPRIKVDSKYTFDAKFSDTTGKYNCFENSIGMTFPIKRTFKTEINLNLSSLKLKDIIKNSVRIKASEILGTFRVTQRQTYIGFDSIPKKNLYYANAGIIGLHFTKKYRILFYSANVTIHEQDKTLEKLAPRFSAIIGQYHIRGLRKGFYYGATVVYSDGLLLPSPFFGGTIPLNRNFTFNYTLPVALNVQYHKNKSYVIVGVKADGYRAGILMAGKRTNLNYTNAAAFVNFRYRFSNIFHAQAECGYNFYQRIQYDKTNNYPYKYPLNGGLYANASLNIYFGKSMLEKIVEQVF